LIDQALDAVIDLIYVPVHIASLLSALGELGGEMHFFGAIAGFERARCEKGFTAKYGDARGVKKRFTAKTRRAPRKTSNMIIIC
jgi:hypothetical protein